MQQPSPKAHALYAQMRAELDAMQQQHQQQLQQNQQLSAAVQQLLQQQQQQQQQPAAPAPSSEAAMVSLAAMWELNAMSLPNVVPFTGTGGAAAIENWRAACQLRFDVVGNSWTEDKRVLFATTHLDGHARQWWSALPAQSRPVTFDTLLKALRSYFVAATAGLQTMIDIMALKQGKMPLLEFCARYRALARQLEMEGTQLPQDWHAFHFANKLSKQRVTAKLLAASLKSLDEAVTMAQKLDIQEQWHHQAPGPSQVLAEAPSAYGSSYGANNGSAAMDLNAASAASSSGVSGYSESTADTGDRVAQLERLCEYQAEMLQAAAFTTRNERGYGKQRYEHTPGVTPEEIQRRKQNHLCYGCGSADHTKRDCPQFTGGNRGGATGGSRGRGGRGGGHGGRTN